MLRYTFGLALLGQAGCDQNGITQQDIFAPDRIYVGGMVLTMDAGISVASAVAVTDGLISAIGDDMTGMAGVGPETNIIDDIEVLETIVGGETVYGRPVYKGNEALDNRAQEPYFPGTFDQALAKAPEGAKT